MTFLSGGVPGSPSQSPRSRAGVGIGEGTQLEAAHVMAALQLREDEAARLRAECKSLGVAAAAREAHVCALEQRVEELGGETGRDEEERGGGGGEDGGGGATLTLGWGGGGGGGGGIDVGVGASQEGDEGVNEGGESANEGGRVVNAGGVDGNARGVDERGADASEGGLVDVAGAMAAALDSALSG